MKLHSPFEEKKARIEIIPLIDIMFFLLASFMAVSLSMIQMRGVSVNLPGFSDSHPELNYDHVAVVVTKDGTIHLENDRVDESELFTRIRELIQRSGDKEPRIYIRADEEVEYGVVLGVLDTVRRAGATKASFQVKAVRTTEQTPQPTR